MKYEFSFEKLEVWQTARMLVTDIYIITESFPDKEKFGLTNQMRRAAVSVCANLAEGASRISPKEQAHFTSIAYGSLIELLNHLIISSDLKFISEEKQNELREKIQPLSVKINNLRNKQLSIANNQVKS
ncbi:MAG: four helix bundle protein [Ferruginibacter sp.]